MITRRLFAFLAGIVLALSNPPLRAQDDMYATVRFANESDRAVKVKVWNSRSENGNFEATVEKGKSVLLTNKDGKPLNVGLGSSQVQVDEQEPKQVLSVASRKGDAYVIVWTKDGFKPKAKE